MKKVLLACSVLLATACGNSPDQNLKLNELEYFETQGVNVWFTATSSPVASMTRRTPASSSSTMVYALHKVGPSGFPILPNNGIWFLLPHQGK